MIKKGKKVVLVTTMLSVLSANVPVVAVYADDTNSSNEPPALDLNEENFVSLPDSIALATQTGMDDWHEPDSPSVSKISDNLMNPGEDCNLNSEDMEQDSKPESPDESEILNSDSSNENGTPLPEDSGSNEVFNSDNRNGSGSFNPKDENASGMQNTPIPNVSPNFNLENSYGNTSTNLETPTDNLNADGLTVGEGLTPNNAENISLSADMPDSGSDSGQDSADAIPQGNGYTFQNGVLTIETNDGFSTWLKNNNDKITEIIIDEAVTGIPSKFFESAKNLTKVTFKGIDAPKNSQEYDNGNKMLLPFGENKTLAVYIPYGSTGYDTQLANWYTLWFLPNLECKFLDDTAYFQISRFPSYKDFSYTGAPGTSPFRNVSYSYRLEIKDPDAPTGWSEKISKTTLSTSENGRWETAYFDANGQIVSVVFDKDNKNIISATDINGKKVDINSISESLIFIQDKEGADSFNVIEAAKLICKLGNISVAGGETYRCLVTATWNGKDYNLTSAEFVWLLKEATELILNSSSEDTGSDSNQNGNGNGSGDQTEDDSDSGNKEDDESNSDEEEDGSDQNTDESDSAQNSGNTIGSVSTNPSQMQGSWNDSSIFGENVNLVAPTINGAQQGNNNKSGFTLADLSENGNNDTISNDNVDKVDDSDTVEVATKGLGLFKGQINVILASFISVLFIARVLMLIIKKRK